MYTNSHWVYILSTMNQMGIFNIPHIIFTPLTLNKLILIHPLPLGKKNSILQKPISMDDPNERFLNQPSHISGCNESQKGLFFALNFFDMEKHP